MRLLLVANVNAQDVTPWKVEVIRRALSSAFQVELVETERLGHAMDLARGAARQGMDLVVALGGDGTVNEVANGLAGTRVPMGILPGGGANVLARSLGIPPDPIEATAHLLAARDRAPRRIGLGRADGRYFTFNCGVGLDGAIVRRVERRQRLKKTVGTGYFVWTALRLFFLGYDRRHPAVRVRWGDDLEQGRDGLFLAICQNTSPYTYFSRRAMRLCPQADLDTGIDLLALDSMRLSRVLRVVAGAFGSARHVHRRHVLHLHDQLRIEVACDRILPVQMDGEFVGERDRLLIEAVPDALSILY